MWAAIKKFDAFPKATDDFRLKTTSGAIGKYRNSIVALSTKLLLI